MQVLAAIESQELHGFWASERFSKVCMVDLGVCICLRHKTTREFLFRDLKQN